MLFFTAVRGTQHDGNTLHFYYISLHVAWYCVIRHLFPNAKVHRKNGQQNPRMGLLCVRYNVNKVRLFLPQQTCSLKEKEEKKDCLSPLKADKWWNCFLNAATLNLFSHFHFKFKKKIHTLKISQKDERIVVLFIL